MMLKRILYLIRFTVFIPLLAGLASCAATKKTLPPVAEKVPQEPSLQLKAEPLSPPEFKGSLYRVGSTFDDLFMDTKARRVGDIVTVKISESSKATNSADTKTGRTSSLEAGIDTLFTIEDWYRDKFRDSITSKLPRPDPFGNPSVKGSMTSDFDGSGSTSRSGDLSAFITCQVTQVLPNNNLRIIGSREVLVNHETQMIILSGVIRPRDINEDNVILSTFVSDAKIAYSGSGIVNDRQRPGWLANLLNSVWPF